jgi:hypothetical protein
MGSETSFLLDLLRDGYKIVCSPAAVGRRIQPQILKFRHCLRAYRMGRGGPHIRLAAGGSLSSIPRHGDCIDIALHGLHFECFSPLHFPRMKSGFHRRQGLQTSDTRQAWRWRSKTANISLIW